MATPSHEAPLTAANNFEPFFVLHKAAAAAVSQPSSPNPKSAKRPHNEDDDNGDGDIALYEQLRLEPFHRTWWF